MEQQPELIRRIIDILAMTKQKPVDELYTELEDYCGSRDEVDSAISQAERCGILDRNAIIGLSAKLRRQADAEGENGVEGEDDDENAPGPSDCYGRNRRGGGRRKKQPPRSRSRSRSRRKRPLSSGRSRSRSQRKRTPKRKA